jgi:hypothetical protein
MKKLLFAFACWVALTGSASADVLDDIEAAATKQDYAIAMTLFRPLAEQGYAGAQFLYGGFFY